MTLEIRPAGFGRVEFFLADTYLGVVMPTDVAATSYLARPVNSGGTIVPTFADAYRVICTSEKAKRLGVSI